MIIQGTQNPEWLRLYRVAVHNKATSKATAYKTFRNTTPAMVWYESGKNSDCIHAKRLDGKPWDNGRDVAYAYIA
jgi:hypothetical protein